jgi:hypothetical protein
MRNLPPLVDDLLWLNRIADDGRPRQEKPLPWGEEASYAAISRPTHPSVTWRRSLAARSEEALYDAAAGRSSWESFVERERVWGWTQLLGFAPATYSWGPVRERTRRGPAVRRVTDPDPILVAFWHSPYVVRLWDDILGNAR